MNSVPLVSIILPIHNGKKWIESCMSSILKQSYEGSIELCVFDDASNDNTSVLVEKYRLSLEKRNIALKITKSKHSTPKGCGYAKNNAVRSSVGKYLCFADVDDVMAEDRIERQLDIAEKSPSLTLIGSRVVREPVDSTSRYTKWINSITPKQLSLQIYTSNGPTLVMPTWFCSREMFDLVDGGFSEQGQGTPEDYLFFLELCKHNVNLVRADHSLVVYRYHPNATTFSVKEQTIWNIRLLALETDVLSNWPSFTIWNAGKQGRKLYRDLSEENKRKVSCFCDVDKRKLNQGVYIYELSKEKPKPQVPIVHFTEASKPFVICVKLDMTDGAFECNLASLNLTEGVDYVVFS